MKNLFQMWHDYKVRRARRFLYGAADEARIVDSSYSERMKEVLYDFFRNYDGSLPTAQGVLNEPLPTPAEGDQSVTPAVKKKQSDERKEVSPKDVLDELERVPNPIDCDPQRVAYKIELMERKLNLGIDQRYTKEHMQGLIDCLKNRLRYDEFKKFYEQYQYTNMEKIEQLLQKYKLCMKESTLFVPTFPEDATKAMEDYTAKTKELTGKRPVFYVIAKEDDFKKKWKKHDPILLVQSPFGFYWQILGAWDDEMLLLEEL